MDLSRLKPAQGATKKEKRIGRGQGSGRGGTSTKGHKGAQARTGYSRKRGFEGGQLAAEGQQVRVDVLDAAEGDEVTLPAKMVVDGDTVLATPDELKGVTVTPVLTELRGTRRSSWLVS